MKNLQSKILVAGDIMLDTYIYGKVERISPEAPVPVMREKPTSTKYVLGGAANVALNLVVTGNISVKLFSVIGRDTNGELLMRKLKQSGIGTDMILQDEDRPTTNKLRYIGQNNQQLLRVDNESAEPVSQEKLEKAYAKLRDRMKEYDLIVLSDYMKGFLSAANTRTIIEMAEKYQIPVFVDIKDRNYLKYKGAMLLKPNLNELHMITGLNVDNEKKIVDASCFLCGETDSQYVLTTLGAQGMIMTDKDRVLLRVRSTAQEVYDVTGAGDTALAYLASEFVRGKEIKEAVVTANTAAGIQVSKSGTSPVYPEEVFRTGNHTEYRKKELNDYYDGGLYLLEELHRRGEKIVFTNGCFDVLHAGHVEYLAKARKLGDRLVVGINSDASVKRLKGSLRPINNLSDRTLLLSALESVDYIIPFEEDTPLEIIKKVMPDILVKGGDYQLNEIVGADFVTENGGTVVTIPFVEGKSTTGIIRRIQEKK